MNRSESKGSERRESRRGQNLLSSSLYESPVESYEHQDNSDIRDQPLPELTLEEQEIYADDDGYHQRYVKADNYVSCHVTFVPLLVPQAEGQRT
jgi:hypothetical protein